MRRDRAYVLYWMIAQRRTRWNFALQRAVEQARALDRPLIVVEALRCDYEWASDRLHSFVLQGMADNVAAFRGKPLLYHPYVESSRGAGRGLLEALAARAILVVTDDYPTFFLPRMINAAGERLDVLLEAVDSNGLLPLRAADRVFSSAYSFRSFLHRHLRSHLEHIPAPDPLDGVRLPKPPALPAAILDRWPSAAKWLPGDAGTLKKLPIDHTVAPGIASGGQQAASRTLTEFLDRRLPRYNEQRSEPEADASSGFSPYLHFGHLSVHEIFSALMTRERWTMRSLAASGKGKREGWWGVGADAEAFLDELITWRELGYNMAWQRDDYQRFDSLPDWALGTLDAHRRDRRTHVYSADAFEQAQTHDPLWNAAQMQIVREGRMHNYMRMLWGKKILEWTRRPEDAAAIMINLNNKYGVDGRDPNSYSGIFWCLGRYDRPWAPERPIFGTIRYMSSDNTARKFSVKSYVRTYAPAGAQSDLYADSPSSSQQDE